MKLSSSSMPVLAVRPPVVLDACIAGGVPVAGWFFGEAPAIRAEPRMSWRRSAARLRVFVAALRSSSAPATAFRRPITAGAGAWRLARDRLSPSAIVSSLATIGAGVLAAQSFVGPPAESAASHSEHHCDDRSRQYLRMV
jgi:hypothetical protein